VNPSPNRLPPYGERPQMAPSVPLAPEMAGPRPHRVLVVDDDPLVRGLFVRLLTEFLPNCEVHEAEDGVMAMEQIACFRPALILLDMIMPRMSGADLCLWLKSGEFADTKVLLISGNANEELKARALAAGAEAWLSKPTSMDTFLCKVRELVGD
jgi:CheY-like chemotaxis protein